MSYGTMCLAQVIVHSDIIHIYISKHLGVNICASLKFANISCQQDYMCVYITGNWCKFFSYQFSDTIELDRGWNENEVLCWPIYTTCPQISLHLLICFTINMSQIGNNGDADVSLEDGLTSAQLFAEGEGYTYKLVLHNLNFNISTRK